MSELELKQALVSIEKTQAENRRLMEMLPFEIEKAKAENQQALADAAKARAENQRLWEMLPLEIEKAKAEVLKLDRESRWYPWLGAGGVVALAITLLKLFGH